jgi:hypothetical protein
MTVAITRSGLLAADLRVMATRTEDAKAAPDASNLHPEQGYHGAQQALGLPPGPVEQASYLPRIFDAPTATSHCTADVPIIT